MTSWLGPHVVPLDAYRRLMNSRDWGKVCALRLFAAGFLCGELVAAIAYWWGLP